MPLILIIIPLVFNFYVLKINKNSTYKSLLFGFIIWGVTILGITELLSFFQKLDFEHISQIWLLVILIQAFAIKKLDRKYLSIRKLWPKSNSIKKVIHRFTRLELFFRISLLVILFFSLTTLCTALIYPPNSGDVLSYHMGRVMHWIQNKSIAPYPTNINRQIWQPPFSEYIFLQLYVLSGSDYFVNIVSWLSMIGGAIVVWLIGFELSKDKKIAMTSALLSLLIPTGILQASGARSDYLATTLFLCFVYLLLRLQHSSNKTDLLFCGLSLGLAVLTKGTIYLFALPFLIVYGFLMFNKAKLRSIVFIVVICVTALLLNLGHFYRNYSVFGRVLGPNREDIEDACCNLKLANDSFSPNYLISNVLRNIAIEIATPIKPINTFIYDSISFIHTLMRTDINDEKNTWEHIKFKVSMVYDDSGANNPLYFSLASICLFLIFIRSKKDSNRKQNIAFGLSTIIAFLFFCFYLKWQSGYSRYHLPVLVVISPLIAMVINSINPKIRRIIIGLLIITAIPYALYNPNRPILTTKLFYQTRLERYIDKITNREDSYQKAAEIVGDQLESCNKIGFNFGRDVSEYLVWVYIKQGSRNQFDIKHVGVKNPTGMITQSPSDRCILVTSLFSDQHITVDNVKYQLLWKPSEWRRELLSVYKKI